MKRISVIFVSFCAILVTVILLSNNIKALSGDFSDLSNIKYENTMSYDEMLEYVEKTRTSEEIAEFKKLHPKIKLRTYAGERRFELWGGNAFYYSFNGDIYQRGVIKWNVGGKIKIGETGELNGSISNGDGFIRNVSESENFNNPLFEK